MSGIYITKGLRLNSVQNFQALYIPNSLQYTVLTISKNFSSMNFTNMKFTKTNRYLTLYHVGCFKPPLCGGCTNQSPISWLLPIWSLLSSGKVIFYFFCNFYKKNAVKFFFSPPKKTIFWQKLSKTLFSYNNWHFLF